MCVSAFNFLSICSQARKIYLEEENYILFSFLFFNSFFPAFSFVTPLKVQIKRELVAVYS